MLMVSKNSEAPGEREVGKWLIGGTVRLIRRPFIDEVLLSYMGMVCGSANYDDNIKDH